MAGIFFRGGSSSTWTVALVLVLVACGSRNVRLVAPDTSPGSSYRCDTGEGQICQPTASDVPEDLNQGSTDFVILPRECRGRFQQIVVLDAGSSHPRVVATCAPQEEPLGETSSREPDTEHETSNPGGRP